MASPLQEPSPRWGHVSVCVEGHLHMWGGRTKDFLNSKGRNKLASSLHTFDPYLETWETSALKGTPPGGLYFGACSAIDKDIYLYGGEDDLHYFGTMHKLDTEKLTWEEVKTKGDFPMSKSGGGMLVYADKLVLFGGFGVSRGPTQKGAEYVKGGQRSDGGGWTNELHIFDYKEGLWTSPAVYGTRPPPCNAFSLTMIDNHRAVLFAGRQAQGKTNDVYILHLATINWTKLEHPEGEPCPVGRSCHAAACLGYGSDCPQLLISGGVSDENEILHDTWMLDLKSGRWRMVSIPYSYARKSHSATAFKLGVGLTEVIIYGGDPTWPLSTQHKTDHSPKIANTTILQFEYQLATDAEQWMLTDAADMNKFGTSERIREKMTKMNRHIDSSPSVTTTEEIAAVRAEFEIRIKTEKENGDRRVQEAEERARVVQRRARTLVQGSDRRAQISEERVQVLEQRLLDSEGRSQELEERAQLSDRRVQTLEDRVKELAVEAASQWLVERREVHMTDEMLGGGGWGEVKVAVFRGARVAAKVLYPQLQYDYYRDLFVREMNMAARIRHPNLVQFIGATLEGEMVILTELMSTNLRDHLVVNQYSRSFVHAVALDTAKGLNYLHLMQPDPIIHRDISSANVLLEPLANNQWRAKITDYGSVNFQRQLKTVGPGSPAYAAPEAQDPSRQSSKMDIFSFGVLLIEVCTCRFPEESARENLIASIKDEQWVGLIKRCIHQDKDQRLSAVQVIAELSINIS